MMSLKKNWTTTLGGILAGLGTLPLLATAAHVALPLWWNDAQFPLFLCGALGTIIMGVAAKGQDEHSTVPQVEAASVNQVANAVAKAAEQPPEAITTTTIRQDSKQ